MEEKIIFNITARGVQLKFETIDLQNQFLSDMKDNGIDFFQKNSNDCYIQTYTTVGTYGSFKSKEGRVGLIFPSEQQKFFFKERAGIRSECFMDMGPGYDAQMHFNERNLRPEPGSSMTAVRKTHAPSPSPK